MSTRKLAIWLNDNIVLLVGIPLIIGIHYGWTKLQRVPYLVDQSDQKDMPLIAALKTFKKKGLEQFDSFKSETVAEPQEK